MAGPFITYPGIGFIDVPDENQLIVLPRETIVAFLGRAYGGPVNMPVLVRSFEEYEKVFGGLWYQSTMSYAVRHFFLNGGACAAIVRIPSRRMTRGRTVLRCPDVEQSFELEAKFPGEWSNHLVVQPTYSDIAPESVAEFNLIVMRHAGTMLAGQPPSPVVEREIHERVSMRPESARFIADVLERESALIRVYAESLVDMPSRRPIPYPMSFDWMPGEDDGDIAADTYIGSPRLKTGIFALDLTDRFDLLCIPPMARGAAGDPACDVPWQVWQYALEYCRERRAVLIVDPPADARSVEEIIDGIEELSLRDENAALYFPRVAAADPVANNVIDEFSACGAIAGMISRTDHSRGVWRAPAGTDAVIEGIARPTLDTSDADVVRLCKAGINVIRRLPSKATVAWGARTLRGEEGSDSEWRFLPVRRLALLIQESVERSTRWASYDSGRASLHARLRLTVAAMLYRLYRKGAFHGAEPSEAYFVRCEDETITELDIERDYVNITIGFAPVKPCEFVIITIRHQIGPTAE